MPIIHASDLNSIQLVACLVFYTSLQIKLNYYNVTCLWLSIYILISMPKLAFTYYVQ